MTSQKQYLVSDYMQTKVPTISLNSTLKQALEAMVSMRTNGLIVVDEVNKVKGVLSSWDIIQVVVPDYLEEDKHLAAFEAGDVFVTRVQELQDKPITEIMSTNVHVCHADHALMEAAAMLSEFRIRQLPVVDHNKTLVGYINRTDIKKAMAAVLEIAV